jgi:hypothetical protein
METTPIEWMFAFLVVAVPVLGLTARFALKPMVDAIVRLHERFSETAGGALLEQRVVEMDQELQRLRAEVARLSQVTSFHESLLAAPGSADEQPTAPADPRV